MRAPNMRDMTGGLLLVGLGGAGFLYATTSYALGTVQTMGPGMVPAGVSALTAIFGLVLCVQALFQANSDVEFSLWGPAWVLAAIATFALLIRSAGLVPAVVAMTLVACLAERRLGPMNVALLAASLAALSYVIFVVGLQFPIAPFRWPF